MAITVERRDLNGASYSPPDIITLSPVAMVELRAVFQPVLADTGEQKAKTVFDPKFVHDYLKGRRNFTVHERVVAGDGQTAEARAHARVNFFCFKEYKDRFKFTWNTYYWTVVVDSARIVKVPAEDIYDFYLELTGAR